MAGKKVKGATITFEVTDDGTLKQVETQAKKTGKGLKNTSKSAGDVRRNLQSMSGRTESASKSFSRLQQGTGGLVQSYAILASTLFAVTAAFRVMQNAADFQALLESQRVFATETGVNLTFLAKTVQDATAAQIDLQAAGASTAIMFAKGFTADQMVEVADASKNAAIALGRNFEDTFNRIVQGTTKAEPELLDELGITLRLETASRRYAAQIGKTRDELTTFEKSQAVLNETLRQAEENFGAIAGKVPVNQLNQLATTFSDLIQSILGFFQPIANFFAKILNQNIIAAIAVIGLFAKAVGTELLGTLGIDMDSLSGKFNSMTSNMADQAAQSSRVVSASFSNMFSGGAATAASESTFQQQAGGFAKSKGKKGSPVLKRAKAGTMFGPDESNLKKAFASAEKQYLRHGKITTGIFKGENIKQVREFQVTFVKKGTVLKGFRGAVSRTATFMGATFSTAFNTLKFVGAKTFAFLGKAAMTFGTIMSKVLSKAGLIGIAILALQAVIAFFNNLKAIGASILDFVASLIEGFAGMIGFAARLIPGLDGVERAARDAAQGIRDKASDLRMSQREDEAKKQKLADLADAAVGVRERFHLLNKTLNEEGGLADPTTTKDIIKLGQALGSSGIVGEIKKIQEISEEDRGKKMFRDMAFETQRYFDRLKDRYPELAEFGDVTEMSAEEIEKLDSIIKTAASEGGGLNRTIKEMADNVMNLRKEYATLASGNVFERELKVATTLESKLAALPDTVTKISDAELSQLEAVLNLTPEKAKQLELNENNRDVVMDLVREHLEITEALADQVFLVERLKALQKDEEKLLGIVKTRTNARINLLNKQVVLEQQMEELRLKQQKELNMGLNLAKEDDRIRQQVLLKHKDQTRELQTQLDVLEAQIDVIDRLQIAFIQAFDKAASQNLGQLLLGEKEAYQAIDGIRQALKKALAQEVVNTFLVDPMTEGLQGLMGKLRKQIDPDTFMGKMLGEEKQTPDQKMATVMDNHVTAFEEVCNNHVTALGGKMAKTQGGGGSTTTNPTTASTEAEKSADKSAEKIGDSVSQKIEEVVTTGTNTEKTGFSAMFGDMGGTMDTFFGNLKGVFTGDGTGIFGKGEGGANSLFGDLFRDIFGGDGEQGMFGKFFSNLTGEGGLGGALQGLMGGGGLGSMLGNITGAGGGLGGLLGGLFGGGGGLSGLLKPLLGMIPGIGPLLSFLPFERGGIIGLAKGGTMPRYASGGIATQPTYLVGEGKQNEAVVPLPDNRSIPVKMNGGAATNNTNISVNIDGNGNASADITADGAAELGQAINLSVMETLVREQRPGGLLNTQG